MTETDVASLLRFFKALGHESRLKLLGLIAQRERTVQELARLLDLSEPTTSHHLGLLRNLELVRLRSEGNLHWYAFAGGGLARLAKSLLSQHEIAGWAGQATEEVPNRLIQNYLELDGRLRQIPATRKSGTRC
jgi:DNA-binding transcriptional ArsR family regulator